MQFLLSFFFFACPCRLYHCSRGGMADRGQVQAVAHGGEPQGLLGAAAQVHRRRRGRANSGHGSSQRRPIQVGWLHAGAGLMLLSVLVRAEGQDEGRLTRVMQMCLCVDERGKKAKAGVAGSVLPVKRQSSGFTGSRVLQMGAAGPGVADASGRATETCGTATKTLANARWCQGRCRHGVGVV